MRKLKIDLQYTLLLLIQHINQFTTAEIKDLHYTLLLLILTGKTLADEELANLHYTLLLLIPLIYIYETISLTIYITLCYY